MSVEEEDDDEMQFEEEEELFLGYDQFSKKRIKEEVIDDDDQEAVPQPAIRPTPSNLFPNLNVDTNRPSLTVTDSVSFYNLGALIVLLYGHVTEGIKVPSIFDKEKQSMVIKETEFNF